MENSEVLKKVKENFKKKRKHWKIDVGQVGCFRGSYDKASELMDFLYSSFNKDDREKYSFNKLSVSVTNKDNLYLLSVNF